MKTFTDGLVLSSLLRVVIQSAVILCAVLLGAWIVWRTRDK